VTSADRSRIARELRAEVAIVGGGPAGLSAALMLGRCRRKVVLCDDGRPRNAATTAIHGFLTRDGATPAELRAAAFAQLEPYEGVIVLSERVVEARRSASSFRLATSYGTVVHASKLLLATGVVDDLPTLEGLARFYGRSVFHCPYCDAWELRDRRLAAYGRGSTAHGLSLELLAWSGSVTLLSDGPASLTGDESAQLRRCGVAIEEARIARLSGREDRLDHVAFEDGRHLPLDGLFLGSRNVQAAALAAALGCDFTDKGTVATGERETTRVPGLFVAGDASGGEQFVVVAAGEGARAAVAIHRELLHESLR
jgi:thioredoxin reductase